MVDRCVGLDRTLDRRVVRRADLAVERADDAGRDGAVEPERVPDRDDAVTDCDVARVGERERDELRRRRVHVHDGEIGARVAADDGPLVGRTVRELHRDGRRAVDDMLVGDDVALRVVDEAGAEGAAAPLGARERRVGVALRRVDLDDARRLLRDLRDAERP